MESTEHDALLLLRQAIAAGSPPIPTESDDASAPEASLSKATHLRFTVPARASIPITAPTRFVSNDKPLDLRSVFFIFLHRESPIPEINASAARLNDELAAGGERMGRIQNIPFLERADLIAWLDGSEESEYVRPLPGDKDAAAASAVTASKGTTAPTAVTRAGRGVVDPRLAVIYNGERKMGDRNSVLRGIKPTDFSHVRKFAAPFITKKAQHTAATSITNNPSLALNQKAPSRRPDPIILLSPSASSLLRMSNIRSFLEGGRYVPPDNMASTSPMLHVSRSMKDIDPSRPLRFILVEGPDQFKQEYWNRLVAVFTTGQTWQFKSYLWPQPHQLFSHVLGVYVGWRGEPEPDNVKAWGRQVICWGIDRWRDAGPGNTAAAEAARFRDKEVVEGIWKAIESSMRAKGWKRDAAPKSI